MIKYTEMEKKLLTCIGEFYFNKNKLVVDEPPRPAYILGYNEAHKEITELQITDIKYDEAIKTMYLTLHRPGLLIGEKGKNIDALREHIWKEFEEDIHISIIETNLNWYLYPSDSED